MTETRIDTIPERDFVAYEHQEMRRGLDRIHEAASLRGTTADLSSAVLEVLAWVDTVLEPHAQWEDRWLYPEIDERAGSPWATRLMTYEHQQIRDAAHAVAAARLALREHGSTATVIELRGRLFALDAIVRAHMAREERFLIPLLDTSADNLPEAVDPRTSPAGAA